MKSIVILMGFIVVAVSFSSCSKPGCTDALAENYDAEATQSDNSCIFERDKFIGTYKLTQACEADDNPYQTIEIVNGASREDVIIKDWFALFDVTAQVDGHKISFKKNHEEWTYEGIGYIAGKAITIDYTICPTESYPCASPTMCTMICYR